MQVYQKNRKLLLNLSKTKPELLCPAPHQVLEAFRLTPPENTEVVCIGQDPYPDPGHAHGLAFSSKKGMTPSLEIIFEELRRVNIARTNPDLTDWACQGVLLLNTILTTQVGISLAHKNYGWQAFVGEALRYVLSLENPIVVMLWGNEAKNFYQEAVRTLMTERHHIKVLEAVHPVAQARAPHKHRFVGCNHFTEANEWLAMWGKEPIEWGT